MIRMLMSLLLSLAFVIAAERTRRDPYKGQNLFMTKNGWTRSMLALPYLGKPDEARRAIVEDKSLRQKFIVELYVWAILIFGVGLMQLL